MCFSNEHSFSPWMHSDFTSYREPVNCCFHCMRLTGNLDIGQACFKGSRERKVLNSSNALSYADHSSSCHGTPLPAERARCRTSLIDVIASLEMGMPPLKGLASSLDGAWPASILKPRSLCSPTGCFLGSPSPHQRKQAKLTLEKGGGR